MAQYQEQRRKIRVKIAGRLTGRVTASVEFQLLDISATGARIAHFEVLRPGTVCAFEFPPELGQLVLSARVIRSTLVEREQERGGEQSLRYESALEFIRITAEQRAALMRILE